MKRILIVCPYPQGKAPSQRFRFEQYLSYLKVNETNIRVSSFWNSKYWPAIYRDSSLAYRVIATLISFVKRFGLLFSLWQFDTIFIHREATPIGPPWWEWCAYKVFHRRLIYDFDDAVWLPNNSDVNANIVGRLKNHNKTSKIISWSETVFAGNAFLAEYASQFCKDVRIVPTTIDLEYHKLLVTSRKLQDENQCVGKNSNERTATIGWTGTHSTLKQLIPLFPLLERVYAIKSFRFLLIADIPPITMPQFVEFREWQKDSEIADLLEISIGIMPLFDTKWERGKCGFKALQYLALEIPAVVSGVGVNREIVADGLSGFICEPITNNSSEQYLCWEKRLLTLLTNENLRGVLGKKGREIIKEQFSVEANKDNYLKVFI